MNFWADLPARCVFTNGITLYGSDSLMYSYIGQIFYIDFGVTIIFVSWQASKKYAMLRKDQRCTQSVKSMRNYSLSA